MKIPFTVEEFMEVFKNYNTPVFSMQIILYLLAGVSIYLSIKRTPWPDKAIAVFLSSGSGWELFITLLISRQSIRRHIFSELLLYFKVFYSYTWAFPGKKLLLGFILIFMG